MFNINSLWSIAGGVIPAISALICTPILITVLGLDKFAIISLILSITLFFYVYDLGMSRTMTFLISRFKNSVNNTQIDLIVTAILSTFLLGVLITVILYLFTPYFVTHWLSVAEGEVQVTVQSFRIALLGIVPGLLSNTFKGMLEGKSNFKASNICKMFSGGSLFLAPTIVVLFFYGGLIYVSWSIVISRLIALLIYVCYALPIHQLASSKVTKKDFTAIWAYGFWAAVSGFISTAFVYGDRFVVAGYLPPEDLSIYIASQDILIRYLLIPWSMAVVLMPVFAANSMAKDKVLDLYKTQQKKVSIVSMGLLLFLTVFIGLFIENYNGINIPSNARYIVIIQIVGVYFCAMSQLPLVYLFGKGAPKLITVIFIFELILYITIAPFVFKLFGVIGACFIWTGRLIIEYAMLKFHAERLMR